MGSPQVEVFWLYDPTTGAPKAGVAGLSFASYLDTSGVPVVPQPTISEIGGGAYYFTPTFPDPNKGIVYVIDSGGNQPLYITRYMRPEDWRSDNTDVLSSTLQAQLTHIRRLQEGRWKIHTSGPDANKLVLYDQTGTVALQKWNLLDSAGMPTYINILERNPTMPIP